jgi:hypothetical protein
VRSTATVAAAKATTPNVAAMPTFAAPSTSATPVTSANTASGRASRTASVTLGVDDRGEGEDRSLTETLPRQVASALERGDERRYLEPSVEG